MALNVDTLCPKNNLTTALKIKTFGCKYYLSTALKMAQLLA